MANFKLEKIVYKCNREERSYLKDKKKFDRGLNDIGLWSDCVNNLQSTLKEFDEVHPNLLNAIYEYREDVEKDENKIAREETANYKLEQLDPNRPVIHWECQMNEKKRRRRPHEGKMSEAK